MCPSCKDEATSSNKCIRCGKVLSTKSESRFVNPKFDMNRFNKLKNGDDEDFDRDLLKQIKKDGDHFGKED